MVHLTISLETSVIIRFARVGQNCEVPAATHLFRPELRSACGNALGSGINLDSELIKPCVNKDCWYSPASRANHCAELCANRSALVSGDGLDRNGTKRTNTLAQDL